MNRAKTVIAIAPVAPPCFSSRDQWLVYLEHAATYQRDDHAPGPLRMTPKGPVFNREFVFCEDCTAQHSHDMHRQRLCKPDYLKTLPELHTTLDEVADEPLGADEANPVTHQQSARELTP